MLKIGDFSKLSRVSIRMLRYYDEIGILKPVMTDKFTDYRYYSEAQLPVVGRITALRDMGFQLAEVHDILQNYKDQNKMLEYLNARRLELEAESAEAARRILLIETAKKRLMEDENMEYDITIKTLPERYAACVRMTIPTYADEGSAWGILCSETAGMNLVPTDPCYCSVLFLDGEYKEHDVQIEAQKTVRGSYSDTEHVKFKMLPEVTFASCTYCGSYSKIDEVNTAIAEWINANGYDFAGEMFNIYHVSPHETSNPDEFVTEVCYPIRKR